MSGSSSVASPVVQAEEVVKGREIIQGVAMATLPVYAGDGTSEATMSDSADAMSDADKNAKIAEYKVMIAKLESGTNEAGRKVSRPTRQSSSTRSKRHGSRSISGDSTSCLMHSALAKLPRLAAKLALREV